MRPKPEAEKIYHIYNRGVDKRFIFLDKWDYVRLIRCMRDFNAEEPIGSLYEKDTRIYKGIENPLRVSDPQNKPLVEFLAYCLLPNHYHFMLRGISERGVSEFMRKLSIGYTNYFNKKYKRSGSLFRGKYQIARAESYSRFLKLSVYVNCNAEVHKIAKASNWSWSSYSGYIGERNGTMCNQSLVLEEFGSSERFKSFCEEVLPDIIRDKELAKSLIEI